MEDPDGTRELWDRIAPDWERQVGTDGDANRQLNSDPVVWAFAGDVRARKVLDAGCGTGYLTAKLRERGADVVGVDFSERMIELATSSHPECDFRVDSCSDLGSIDDGSIDVVVSNYVLMDTPELEETVTAFHRVLTDGGIAVVVFSHPCFPAGRSGEDDRGQLVYHWEAPYFERRRYVDEPWGHFTSEFVWFHRPLSDYWKAFTGAGFDVVDFEEPRVTGERFHLAESESALHKSRTRPYSVAFKLRKRGHRSPGQS